MTRPSSFSYEDLIACGNGEMFGPGNAQLPKPNMLMADRITTINEDGGDYKKGKIIAEIKSGAKAEELNKVLVDKGIYVSHLLAKEKSLEKFFLEITNHNHV